MSTETNKDLVLAFEDGSFKEEVLDSSQPVLVDFWAAWCGPCRLLGPTIHELSSRFEGRAKVGKLNVDENGSTAATYGISSIPSVLIFKGGEVVASFVGVQPVETYSDALEKLLNA